MLYLFIPYHPRCLANYWSFYCLHIFGSSRMTYIWNHIAFSDELLLLSNMHLRSLDVCSWLDSSFPFECWIIFHCLDEPVYPFTQWRTSWLLPWLASMNEAAMNTCLQVYVWTWVFNSFGQIQRSTTAGLYSKDMFSFLRNQIQSGCTILYFHQQWVKVPVASHPYQRLVLSVSGFWTF